MRKYFFFDVDGTLTSPHQRSHIIQSTRDTLKLLKKKGHFVAIATGRTQYLVEDIAAELGIDHYICEGGRGMVINREYVKYNPFKQEAYKKLLMTLDLLHIPYVVQIDNTKVLYSKHEYSAGELFNDILLFHDVIVDAGIIDHPQTVIHRIFLDNDQEKLRNIEGFASLNFMFHSKHHFGIIEPDVKHEGIAEMIELMGGSLQDVVVFGDGTNDLSMFEKAQFSIAMGNAVPQLKEIADYVTADSDKDGIYLACKKFGWI